MCHVSRVQVYRTPQMKNTTNLLILNLAVADLLFLLVCVPATASDYVLMYWPFGLAWCRCVRSDQRNYADKGSIGIRNGGGKSWFWTPSWLFLTS